MLNLFLKATQIKIANYITISIFNNLRSLKNSLETILKKNNSNFYIPNFFVKNIILINPKKIKYRNAIPMKFKRKSTPFIINFDWDKKNELLSEFQKYDHTHITCNQLFVEGLEIQKTKEYFFFKKKIESGIIIKNCENENDIFLYYKNLIETFKNIKKHGVKKIIENNIEFMIDRNFNLVKINGGNHRFFMARILGLKSIPVEIKVVHSECFTNDKNKIVNYKDLNKLINKIQLYYK